MPLPSIDGSLPFIPRSAMLFISVDRLSLVLSGLLLILPVSASSSSGLPDRPSAEYGTSIQDTDNIVITDRRSNYVRKGPGSFHKVVAVVKKDIPLDVLERKNGWVHVQLPDTRKGWIARTSVERHETPQNVTTQDVADEWVATEATQSGVAAAVRGFQMNADGLDKGSLDALLSYRRSEPTITASDLERFRERIASSNPPSLDLNALDMELAPYDPSVQERRVGLAVAARLAQKGTIDAPLVRRYLILLTESLTEDTPYYDQEFEVVIIEGEGPDAFACPGGLIFLTRGVFTHFETEAQLAGLLAHEIGHVVQRHGMAEREKQETRRRADAAFSELEEATDDENDKYAEVESDLNSMMRESYERVVNDRLLKYEKEADRMAAALLGEAGYAPSAIVEAVEHIAALRTSNSDLFGEEYLEAQNLTERTQHVEAFVNQQGSGMGATLPDRFQTYQAELAPR